jgi:lysophospholipase
MILLQTLFSVLCSIAFGASITDYAPTVNVLCPDITIAPLLRVFNPANQTLNPFEESYISARGTDAWGAWIGNGTEIGYNASLFAGKWSTVGIAFSGGGYRAALYGAGVLSALDARNESAMAAGTGGLLQVASYVSGLSGALVS